MAKGIIKIGLKDIEPFKKLITVLKKTWKEDDFYYETEMGDYACLFCGGMSNMGHDSDCFIVEVESIIKEIEGK